MCLFVSDCLFLSIYIDMFISIYDILYFDLIRMLFYRDIISVDIYRQIKIVFVDYIIDIIDLYSQIIWINMCTIFKHIYF